MFTKYNYPNYLKLVGGAVLLGCSAFVAQDEISLQDLTQGTPKVSSVAQRSFNKILLPDAIQLYYSGNAVFIDARSSKIYDYAHIKDAFSITETDSAVDAVVLDKIKSVPNVVIYCNNALCGLAEKVGRKLTDLNISPERIQIYSAGWPEWRSCRLPMEGTGDFEQALIAEQQKPKA